MAKLFLLLCTLLVSSFIYGQDIEENEYCQIQLINTKQSSLAVPLVKENEAFLFLPAGESRLRLNCRLDEQAVITFDRDELLNISVPSSQVKLTQLNATSPSYLIPSGDFSIDFLLFLHHEYNQKFAWQPIASFYNYSVINNIVMGIFYGLCLTLILYVYFMGRIVGDNRFQFYSLYVFCASTFFLLQEGQLVIFLPQQSFLLTHQFYVLFAGLTVFTATIFIVRLTDLGLAWPKLTRYGLELGASCVLLISMLMLFIPHNNFSAVLGSIMARMTMLIMLAIFTLVSIQAYRNIKSAKIVILSLALMVIAMVLRTVFPDFNPFLQRYALIIAFAVEAFMLAVAVSARIKSIRTDQILAESQANTDALCNVLNRRGWDKKANHVLSEHKIKGGVICLLYIDLNDFKQINDNWGHDAGDKVLTVVTDIIRHQLRSIDNIGRVGGDEFVVLGHFNDRTEAEDLALRVQDRLKTFALNIDKLTTLNISASVGYVIYDKPPAGIDEMLIQADKSMYQTKRSNKAEFKGNIVLPNTNN
jgi:diguanylate cyclase (GGDEF)-like protein